MGTTTTRPWDVTESVAAALGDIRPRPRHDRARQTGLGRESLYKALSPEGNPEFSTILKVGNPPVFSGVRT